MLYKNKLIFSLKMSGKCFALNNIFGIFFKRKKKRRIQEKLFFLFYPEYMLAICTWKIIYLLYIYFWNEFFLYF